MPLPFLGAWSRLRTQIKIGVNACLDPLGLQLTTSRQERTEAERLRKLQARGHWNTPRYTGGLSFDERRYREFLEQVCLPYRQAYNALARRKVEAEGDAFFLDNGYFGPVDAEVLYGIIRHFRPGRMVEVGSGFSSRLARRAITDAAGATRLTCIDPDPRTEIQACADEHLAVPVEELEVAEIARMLAENNILFIDSSHTLRTGGDVPFLFLELLPRLCAGVFIHVHDIFLPFDYPEEWMVERRWGKTWTWNEQYLVHAFLCFNDHFEIVWPSRSMWEYQRAAVVEAIPSAASGIRMRPSSLWLRKVR